MMDTGSPLYHPWCPGRRQARADYSSFC